MPPLLSKTVLLAASLSLVASLPAAEIAKTNDANALNLGTSWVGGVAPGSSDIALFDSTLALGTALTPAIGGAISWGGIKVVNPAAVANIYNTGTGLSSNILTLGSGGIDMSAATQNLTIRASLLLGADQTWSVATGRTLGVDGWGVAGTSGQLFNFDLGNRTLTKTGAGILNIINGFSPSNGTIAVAGGQLVMSNATSGPRITGAASSATVRVDTGGDFRLFNNITAAYTIGSDTFQPVEALRWDARILLNGGVFNFASGGAGPVNIGGTIEAAAGTSSQISYVNTNGAAGALQRDIASAFTGTGSITFNPSTTTAARLVDRVTLLGDNSAFAGTLIVNSTVASSNRTLRLGAAQSGSAAAAWSVAADNTLEVHGVNVSLGSLASAGTVLNSGTAQSSLTIGDLGTNTTFSGVLNGGTAGFRLVKVGTGTLTLSGTNSAITGGIVLRQGGIAFSNVAAFTGGAITLGAAATTAGILTLNFNENNTTGRTVATNMIVAASDATEVRIGRTATTASGMVEVIYSGQLTLARGVTLFNATSGSGQTRFNGKITGTGDISLAFTGSGSNPGIVFANPTNGANDFVGNVRIGSSVIFQLGVNSTGMTDVIPNASRVIFEAATGTFRLSSASETIAGLQSLVAGGGTVTTNRTTTGGGSVTLTLAQTSTSESLDFGGVIADQAANAESWKLNLTKSGAGVQRLSGLNSSYAGITTLVGGVLEVAKLANGGSNSSIGKAAADAANLVFSGGTLRYIGAGDTTDRLFTMNAGGAISAEGTGALVLTGTGALAHNNPANNRTLTLSGVSTADNSLAAQLVDPDGDGTLALAKSGAGTWILSGANTYSGGTTVNAGILRVGADGALGAGPVSLVGGTLDLAGLTFAGEITLGGGLLANAANWTGAAVITSTTSAAEINSLTQSTVSVRTGTVSLAGVNKDVLLSGGAVSNLATFGGALVASGGTVDLSAGDFAGTLGLSGGTADFGATVSTRAINYASGAVTGAAYTGDIVVNGANVALGATLAAGTVVLTAGNSATLQAGFARDIRFEGGALANFGSYTGLITVANSATFDLDGDSLLPFETAARFSLASGSRLKGTGTVGGLSVLAGGILALGNSPGRLIVEGDLDLAATAVFEVEILAATGALGESQAGDDYDTIDVTGLLDLSQLTPTERFVITLISLADPTTAGPLFDFDPAQAYTFTLFTYGELDLGANAALADLFIIDTAAFRDLGNNTVAAERFSIFDTGSSIVLTYSAIPEPSTYGLALGALALAGAAYRRRARRHGGTAAQGPKLAR